MKVIVISLFVVLAACVRQSNSDTTTEKAEIIESIQFCNLPRNPSNISTEPSLSDLIDSLQLKKEELHILIDKSDYKLYVIADTSIVKTYATVFGTNPIDDKLMQGDRSTPEGNFKVREFYPHKSWSKFIWIDYPNESSWKKHNKAKEEHRIPADASIGGEIGIHGVPKNSAGLIANKQNWTWGCISLSNKDVNELYTIIHKNMSIKITK